MMETPVHDHDPSVSSVYYQVLNLDRRCYIFIHEIVFMFSKQSDSSMGINFVGKRIVTLFDPLAVKHGIILRPCELTWNEIIIAINFLEVNHESFWLPDHM